MKQVAVSLLLLVVFLAVSGVAVAAGLSADGPIRYVETVDGFAENLTAGETDHVTVAFQNNVRQSLPLYAVLTVSSPVGIDGGEFTPHAVLFSQNTAEEQFTAMNCSYAGNRNATEGVYLCTGDDSMILPRATQPSWNTLNMQIDTALNTAPASYDFRLDLLSRIGLPTGHPKHGHIPPKTSERFVLDTVNVTVTAIQHTAVTVEPYDALLIPAPDDTGMVAGFGIGAETNGTETSFTGTTTVPYDADLNTSTLTVYHHDGLQWQELPYTVSHEEQTVTADLNGPGTYGLFGNEVEDPEKDDDRSDKTDPGDTSTDRTDSSGSPSQDPAPTCTADDWTCGDWSACTDGTQTRSCDPARSCVPDQDDRPVEERSCAPDDSDETDGYTDQADNRTEETDADEDDASGDGQHGTEPDHTDADTDQGLGAITGDIAAEASRESLLAGLIILFVASVLLLRQVSGRD